MIIKNKNLSLPINDLFATLLLGFPFGIFAFIIDGSFYDRYVNSIKFEHHFNIENGELFLCIFFNLLFICFIVIGIYVFYKYKKELKNKENILFIDIKHNNIEVVYSNKKITINKNEIKKIDITFMMINPIATYNRGCMLPKSYGEILEYIDFIIHTKDNKLFKVRKDFFILYDISALGFLINLQEILKSYTELYVLAKACQQVGLKTGKLSKQKIEQKVFLSNLINLYAKTNKIFKMHLIILSISFIILLIIGYLYYIYICNNILHIKPN